MKLVIMIANKLQTLVYLLESLVLFI